jgi:hypothetical protein
MVPNDLNVKKTYGFTITGTADGGATYVFKDLELQIKCLGGIGFTGISSYATEIKYPKIVGSESTSIYTFPTTMVGILESICPIISY